MAKPQAMEIQVTMSKKLKKTLETISLNNNILNGIELDGIVNEIKFEAFRDIPETDKAVVTKHRIFPNASLYHPQNPKEPIEFDEKFRKELIKSFKASGLQIQIDFNHSSGGGLFSGPTIEDGAAAGWITELYDEGDKGLYADINWTDKGLKAIRAREYKYLSPEFSMKHWSKASGGVIEQPKLYAVALTNRPFLENQKRLAASELEALNNKTAQLSAERGTKMAEEKASAINESAVADVLALKDDLAAMQAKLDEAKAREQEAINKLSEIEASAKAKIINQGIEDGKITPAMVDGIEKFAEHCTQDALLSFVDALQVQVKKDKESVDGKQESEEGFMLSDEDRSMAKALGLSPDDYKKHLGMEQ